MSVKELQINEDIRDKEVRVIGADGEQLGVMDTREAQRISLEKSLDLVKIAPQAVP
ncbi:MAG: translation initiation factor IF-3, partial [Oscillospiraceae bacterium]